MKDITFSLSGRPTDRYKPVCVMTNNDQIRRTAETYLASKYDGTRHIWIDRYGSAYAQRQDVIPTDLYIREDNYGIYIQNSVFRG